ncbi:MAG: hypothetical protein KGH95_07440 [Thaumarchaeota archaeon]|nr:hypothetical protein [Nitrososphaerota archaeon]
MKNANYDLVHKALVGLTIEQVLLKIGKPIYDKAVSVLNEKYQCYIFDCYDHPQYLGLVFHELFGDAHHVVVKEIKKELIEFSHKCQISQFLEAI